MTQFNTFSEYINSELDYAEKKNTKITSVSYAKIADMLSIKQNECLMANIENWRINNPDDNTEYVIIIHQLNAVKQIIGYFKDEIEAIKSVEQFEIEIKNRRFTEVKKCYEALSEIIDN